MLKASTLPFHFNRRPTGNPRRPFCVGQNIELCSYPSAKASRHGRDRREHNLQVLPKSQSCFLNCSPVLSISLPPISCADCLSRLHSLRNASYGSLSSIARSISPHSTLETKCSATVSAFHYIAPHIAPQPAGSIVYVFLTFGRFILSANTASDERLTAFYVLRQKDG